MATFTSGELAGIIIGSILGTLFLLTCVLSAVKAVKDRRLIKARIREKKRAYEHACRLKREGRLTDSNVAISIEDPGYFSRNGLNQNNHRVVGQSNSYPTNSRQQGTSNDNDTSKQSKRNSEPLQYDRSPYAGQRRARQPPDDFMSVGVYRYKGEHTNGVENAAFEMKESNIAKNNNPSSENS